MMVLYTRTTTRRSGACGFRLCRRLLTERFQDVNVATSAGYVPVSPCEALPGVGGMGIHDLNPALG